MIEPQEQAVTARVVRGCERSKLLLRYLGLQKAIGERLIFVSMSHICPEYNGGMWHLYELSSGGFYAAPDSDKDMDIVIVGNYFEATVSADAAGIIATLFALGRLACDEQAQDQMVELYHQLRDYTYDHPERAAILKAID